MFMVHLVTFFSGFQSALRLVHHNILYVYPCTSLILIVGSIWCILMGFCFFTLHTDNSVNPYTVSTDSKTKSDEDNPKMTYYFRSVLWATCVTDKKLAESVSVSPWLRGVLTPFCSHLFDLFADPQSHCSVRADWRVAPSLLCGYLISPSKHSAFTWDCSYQSTPTQSTPFSFGPFIVWTRVCERALVSV